MKNFGFYPKGFIYLFAILLSINSFHNFVFAYHEDDFKKVKDGCKFFIGARLNDADLKKINFDLAYFPVSSFNGATFQGSSLVDAILNDSDFESVDFEDANLTDAFFNKSILLNVKFKNTKVKGASFYKVYGLTNDQKKYLRENGAASVPNDLTTDKEIQQELIIIKIMREYYPEKK